MPASELSIGSALAAGSDVSLRGRRVTVLGLGRHGGGVAAAGFLARQGARVTVTDAAPAEALAASLAELQDIELVGLRLGGHAEEDFATAELVVVNPAVRPGHAMVELARRAGARITSEIELVLERVPETTIGVTGSNGKSTTAAMIAEIIAATGRRAWLGGNIGRSLLADLPKMASADVAVLELSSFQLYWLSADARLPEIAAITNCTPNHLDWHPDFEHYARTKERLLAVGDHAGRRRGTPTVVLGDSLLDAWSTRTARRVIAPVADGSLPPLAIPGDHNRRNAACAAAAAMAAGCAQRDVVRALAMFVGLPHRLETVGVFAGRRYINDTQATTPESAIAALRAIDRPCWVLCGGADKGSTFAALCDEIVRRASGAACFGSVGGRLHDDIRGRRGDFPCVQRDRLDEAVAWCVERSRPGDAIVLSPGCASTDQYRDYAERAADFRAAVERHARLVCGVTMV